MGLLLCAAQVLAGNPSGKGPGPLSGMKILYVERDQYAQDHHNTATLFQYGEINEGKFSPGAAMYVYDADTGKSQKILEITSGVIRDPEISYDGKKVVFSMRRGKTDYYHIYEMNVDGTGLRQLTFAGGISDIDPFYLPDGDIIFSSTRQPKYCMCNRHIMCNLYRMHGDGANITQIGISTLFEGHSTLLADGRILYDRWEYVDRNFGDAQGLWTANPDGTKHAVYYGNNTPSPGGIIDAREIPGTVKVVCTLTSCHDRPWGSVAVIDRRKGIDNGDGVVWIWPADMGKYLGKGNIDTFKRSPGLYEDPYPVDENHFLVSKVTASEEELKKRRGRNMHQDIYLLGTDGTEYLVVKGEKSLFDPHVVAPRPKPLEIPAMRNFCDKTGTFYVENVYEGTHMEGVEKGAVKWLRVVESPEKRTWTGGGWYGQGEQAPAMNWHSFENKRIIGEVPVEEDGSVNFKAPAGKFLFFQLLDKDKKMIQSMRSGVTLMPGEINGCIGCHEDRLTIPVPLSERPLAMKKKPAECILWQGKEPFKFSFMEHVQPILDRNCVKCHDFDPENRDKLVLARDMNPYFNAAYINLYVKKEVTLVGGGPADIQPAYSWGSHASKLTKVIDGAHHGVSLSKEEKETLYTWMDLNGVYYPVYESAFDHVLAGRSPLTAQEFGELKQLTGLKTMNSFTRQLPAQISFDRPEMSPILDSVRNDKTKYDRVIEILKIGQARLKETPRGDIESELVPCERNRKQLEKYIERIKINASNDACIDKGGKVYDSKD